VKHLLLLTFVFTCFFVKAQHINEPVASSNHSYLTSYKGLELTNTDSKLLDFQYVVEKSNAPGQRNIRTGKTLTIAGGILVVGGVALMATADEIYYSSTSTPNGTVEEGDPQGGIGAVLTLGGVGMIIPGAILWSKGRKKYAAYKAASASLSLGVNKNGAGLRFRF
jgi:hypothetical protein